jgi:hypothetical protein
MRGSSLVLRSCAAGQSCEVRCQQILRGGVGGLEELSLLRTEQKHGAALGDKEDPQAFLIRRLIVRPECIDTGHQAVLAVERRVYEREGFPELCGGETAGRRLSALNALVAASLVRSDPVCQRDFHVPPQRIHLVLVRPASSRGGSTLDHMDLIGRVEPLGCELRRGELPLQCGRSEYSCV